eukprot:4216832-Alexandrium_andersonii.AAC.1
MSASLVGSEMCIRDRPTGPSDSKKRTTIGQRSSKGNDPHRREQPTDTRAPVSYTHLTLPTICSV